MTERMTPEKALAAVKASDDGLCGVDHRFVEFTKDFAAWVIFYGQTGGEATE